MISARDPRLAESVMASVLLTERREVSALVSL
jgi:hypothetical protein